MAVAITISQLENTDEILQQTASADLPTCWDSFRILGFELQRKGLSNCEAKRETGVALIMGDIQGRLPLLRIHSQCLTGDAFGSLRCDCEEQLQISVKMIGKEQVGLLIYEEQEGRGVGLISKLQAYELQDQGCDTVEANESLRIQVGLPRFLLASADSSSIRDQTRTADKPNNPEKVQALRDAGIEVAERIPCEDHPTSHGLPYLRTKKEKMGHMLTYV